MSNNVLWSNLGPLWQRLGHELFWLALPCGLVGVALIANGAGKGGW